MTDLRKRNDELMAALEAAHTREAIAERQLAELQQDFDALKARAEAAEAERDELQARVTELEDLMASANDSIRELHFSEQEATAALAEALEVVREGIANSPEWMAKRRAFLAKHGGTKGVGAAEVIRCVHCGQLAIGACGGQTEEPVQGPFVPDDLPHGGTDAE